MTNEHSTQQITDFDTLLGLLERAVPIIMADAQMMADISRFAPLPPSAQAAHDSRNIHQKNGWMITKGFLKHDNNKTEARRIAHERH